MAATENIIPPELEQLVITEVKLTGNQLGTGAYGSVEEGEIPGAKVATKRLHAELVNLGSSEEVSKFVTPEVAGPDVTHACIVPTDQKVDF